MSKYRRPLAVVILVLLVLFAPFWIYLPALFVALVYFPVFWEGIILGFLIDTLYAPTGISFWRMHIYALSSLIISIIMIPVRERFRLN